MLEQIIDWFFYSLFGLDSSKIYIKVIHYFVYDTIKIMFLLFFMISFIGFFRTYVPQDKIKKWISGRKYGLGHFFASVFGVITPFCSCSSIPFFISFIEIGVPLGVTFSFLITSPLVNEYLVILMFEYFGFKITLAYVLFGILIGVITGLIIGRMGLEKYLVSDFGSSKTQLKNSERIFKSKKERVVYGVHESFDIIKKIWKWVFIGVLVGAVIHNYIPSEFIHGIIEKVGVMAVPIVTVLGVPMYGGCAAIVPIAVVLFNKGVPLGTALAFMMATSALSFPEAVILRRVMKLELILIFFGIVTVAIIFIGYLFNLIQFLL